jgi:hypothetical protein
MNKKHKKLSQCTNCNFKFESADNYCPECGQKNHELKIPLKHLFEEMLESTLHFDTKAIKTLKQHLFAPGTLSKEYNEGRRAKFISPVRLYVVISFIFFLILNFTAPKKIGNAEENRAANNNVGISINIYGISTNDLAGISDTQVDSLLAAKGIEKTKLKKFLISQLHKIANEGSGEFIHSVIKNISYMMFFLMPGFAFFVFILFRKQTKYYIESLILSIHFHSFIFLLLSIFFITTIVKTILFVILTPIMVTVYLFLMLYNYYGQKTITILWKTSLIEVFHLLLFILMFIFTIMLSVVIV